MHGAMSYSTSLMKHTNLSTPCLAKNSYTEYLAKQPLAREYINMCMHMYELRHIDQQSRKTIFMQNHISPFLLIDILSK